MFMKAQNIWLHFQLVIGLAGLMRVDAFTDILKKHLIPSSSPRSLKAVALEPLAQEGSWSAYLDNEKTGLIYYFNAMTGERSWTAPSKTFPMVDAENLRTSWNLEQDKSEKFTFDDLQEKFVNLGKTLFGDEDAIQYDNLSQEENFSLQHADSLFSPIEKDIEEQVTSLKVEPSNYEDEIINANIVNDNIFQAHYGRVTGKVTDQLEKVGERIEKTKTFLAGFAGGVVSVPFVAFQDIVMKFQLSDAVLDKFYFDTSINSIECALFALMLRFCVREGQESNEILNDGIITVFTLVRTMSKMSGHGQLDWGLIPQATIGGLESFVMFSAAAAVYDFGCKHHLISRLK